MNSRNATTTRPRTDGEPARLDAMRERSAEEVLGILRQGSATSPEAPSGIPTGLWKTGWQAQPEGAA